MIKTHCMKLETSKELIFENWEKGENEIYREIGGPENILSEKTQTQKDKCSTLSLIWES